MRTVTAPTAEDLAAAAAVVGEALVPTPTVECSDLGIGLKLETQQPTGAFKVRGALAALARIPADAHVVTPSAGNHALAMVWAAARTGHRVTVYVSHEASPVKLEALARLGADVQKAGHSYDDAERAAIARAADGAVFVSSYNDTGVVAGSATLGPELEGAHTIVAPLGGGGLMAGLCAWAAGRADVRLVGVELATWRQWSAARAAGRVVEVDGAETIGDGAAGNIEPGSMTFELVRDRMDELVAVDELELRDAIRFLATHQGIIAEGAGAMAVAAVLTGRAHPAGRTVALVTGRNIKPATLAQILL